MGGCFSSGKPINPYGVNGYGAAPYGAAPYGAAPYGAPYGTNVVPLGPSMPVAYPQGKHGPPVVPMGPPTPHFNPGLVDSIGIPNSGYGPYGAINSNPAVFR